MLIMSNPTKPNPTVVGFAKLIKSPLVSLRSKQIFGWLLKDILFFAKMLESVFMGWRFMNDITVFCFVVAIYFAAASFVKNTPKGRSSEKTKCVLESNSRNRLTELLGSLTNPAEKESDRRHAIAIQNQPNGFRDLFVTFLMEAGEKSRNNEEFAQKVYEKFEKRLKKVTRWKINRAEDMKTAQEQIKKALSDIFVQPVVSGIVPIWEDDSGSEDEDGGSSTARVKPSKGDKGSSTSAESSDDDELSAIMSESIGSARLQKQDEDTPEAKLFRILDDIAGKGRYPKMPIPGLNVSQIDETFDRLRKILKKEKAKITNPSASGYAQALIKKLYSRGKMFTASNKQDLYVLEHMIGFCGITRENFGYGVEGYKGYLGSNEYKTYCDRLQFSPDLDDELHGDPKEYRNATLKAAAEKILYTSDKDIFKEFFQGCHWNYETDIISKIKKIKSLLRKTITNKDMPVNYENVFKEVERCLVTGKNRGIMDDYTRFVGARMLKSAYEIVSVGGVYETCTRGFKELIDSDEYKDWGEKLKEGPSDEEDPSMMETVGRTQGGHKEHAWKLDETSEGKKKLTRALSDVMLEIKDSNPIKIPNGFRVPFLDKSVVKSKLEIIASIVKEQFKKMSKMEAQKTDFYSKNFKKYLEDLKDKAYWYGKSSEGKTTTNFDLIYVLQSLCNTFEVDFVVDGPKNYKQILQSEEFANYLQQLESADSGGKNKKLDSILRSILVRNIVIIENLVRSTCPEITALNIENFRLGSKVLSELLKQINANLEGKKDRLANHLKEIETGVAELKNEFYKFTNAYLLKAIYDKYENPPKHKLEAKFQKILSDAGYAQWVNQINNRLSSATSSGYAVGSEEYKKENEKWRHSWRLD